MAGDSGRPRPPARAGEGSPGSAEESRSERSLVGARERKRILDAATLAIIATSVAAVGIPWFFGLLELDLGPVAWAAAAYAGLYLGAAALSERARSVAAIDRATRLLQLTQVAYLAVCWHLVGGVDNPAFLLAFFLPVAAAGSTFGRGQPLLVAALATLLATLTAALESPALRWYLAASGLPLAAPLASLARLLPERPRPFPYLADEPVFLVVLLVVLASFLLATAVVARTLAQVMARLGSRLSASERHLSEVQDLFQSILAAEPDPGLIVYADTGQVVHASKSFLRQMLVQPEDLAGKTVYDVVRFPQPERVQGLLDQGGGEAPFCPYQVGAEVRVANLSCHGVVHAGTRYAYLGWRDVTEQYYFQAAFDAVTQPLLVVGPDERLRYANRAAEEALGAVYFGREVGDLLAVPERGERWWRALDSADPVRVELAGRPWRVTAIQVRLPGEPAGSTILTLQDIGREEDLAEQANVDPLTGVFSQRHLEETLSRAAGEGTPLSLALLDIDDFRPLNDELGRAAGDAALRRFARLVQSELAPGDQLARLSADRFAVLFPGVAAAEASVAVDRIQLRVRRSPLTYEEAVRPLDFSAGIAGLRPGESATGLLDRVGGLLAQAKHKGKGQWRIDM